MSVGPDPSDGPETTLRAAGPSASAPAGRSPRARVIGVDVARGLALLGMFAVHIFDALHADNTPSKTHQVMAGHSLATLEELLALAQAGGLTDAKTLIGLLWLQNWRNGQWNLDWQRRD